MGFAALNPSYNLSFLRAEVRFVDSRRLVASLRDKLGDIEELLRTLEH